MIGRIIDFLFVVTFTLILAFIVLVAAANADTSKGMLLLRKTAVRIDGTGCMGSASVVEGKSGRKYLLTNQHLCNCAKYRGDIYGTFEDGKLLVGKVVKQDWTSDLCAARVSDKEDALRIGKALPPLTEVSTRGYPGGRLTESHGRSAGSTDWDTEFPIEEIGACPRTSEPLYGFNGVLGGCRMHYRSTLSNLFARPGASGSAVINDDGELVGVISSWHAGSDFGAGLVPFEEVKKFLGGL